MENLKFLRNKAGAIPKCIQEGAEHKVFQRMV